MLSVRASRDGGLMNRYNYMDTSLKDIIINAQSGNVVAAVRVAKEVQSKLTVADEIDYCERFLQRFNKNHVDIIDINATKINKIISCFENYWQSEMLKEDVSLRDDEVLFKYIKKTIKYYQEADNNDELLEEIKEIAKNHGYKSLVGRVIPYQDILLWENEEKESKDVDLIDSNVSIEIKKLNDFKVLGWIGYATLDLIYVGGWAVGNEINAVMPAWKDVDCEYYDVRLITHEAQHCSDYKLYPDITPEELEYRAKLTEIYFAKNIKRDVIKKFKAESEIISESPHIKASNKIFKELSKKVDVKESIESNEYDQIDDFVYEMFIEDTKRLQRNRA